MGLGGAKRSRSPSDASPVAFCLLCRHGQSRSPPAGGEIPPAGNGRIRTLPPHPPQCAHWGTFPPRGKAFGRPHGAAPTEKGKAFGRPSVPPLRRKGRFSGGEDTAPTEKRMLVGAPVGHSGVPKWAGFHPRPRGALPLRIIFSKRGTRDQHAI